jgi:hypothetical protein
MGDGPRTILEGIDYARSFRFTRIFQSFRIAVHPSRLGLALLLIVAMYATGRLTDAIWGPQVLPTEFESFVKQPTAQFETWFKRMTPAVEAKNRQGIFETALRLQVGLFDNLVRAAVQFEPGFDQLMPSAPPSDQSVIGSIRIMLLLPVWLWHAHPWFLVVWLIITLALWSLFGGALTRSAVVDAARGRTISASEAFVFSFRRWGWYLLAPVMPLIVVAVLALLLALYGLLFNVPVLDVVAGLLFIGALGLGFLIAMLIVGWVAGVHLMYPALSAEGTDAFDAVSRAFSYVLARPWRLVGYSFVALVYGAISYLFVGVIIFLIIFATRGAVAAWVFVDSSKLSAAGKPIDTVDKFDALFPMPMLGQLAYKPAWDHLGITGDITATLIMVWVYLLIGVLGAFAISFYFSSFSVIYLLLRRHTDGSEVSQVFEPAQINQPVAEKVEPAPSVAASPAPASDAPITAPPPPTA